MSLIAFRRGRDQAERWKDGRLQEEPPPPPPEPSAGAADPGEEARSFYESLIAEGGGAEPARDPLGEAERPRSPAEPPRFCRSCGTSFRDPPARHRRCTAHLLGLGAPPAAPAPPPGPRSGPGYRLLLRAGWAGGGLGRGGRGRRLPVPTRLKRDRAGLGWGPAPPPRITHFGPGDAAAVAGPSRRGAAAAAAAPGEHRERSRVRSEAEARAWEIRLREYMERWDPPEPPPRAKRDPP